MHHDLKERHFQSRILGIAGKGQEYWVYLQDPDNHLFFASDGRRTVTIKKSIQPNVDVVRMIGVVNRLPVFTLYTMVNHPLDAAMGDSLHLHHGNRWQQALDFNCCALDRYGCIYWPARRLGTSHQAVLCSDLGTRTDVVDICIPDMPGYHLEDMTINRHGLFVHLCKEDTPLDMCVYQLKDGTWVGGAPPLMVDVINGRIAIKENDGWREPHEDDLPYWDNFTHYKVKSGHYAWRAYSEDGRVAMAWNLSSTVADGSHAIEQGPVFNLVTDPWKLNDGGEEHMYYGVQENRVVPMKIKI